MDGVESHLVGQFTRPASACGPRGSVDSAVVSRRTNATAQLTAAQAPERGRKQGRGPQARRLKRGEPYQPCRAAKAAGVCRGHRAPDNRALGDDERQPQQCWPGKSQRPERPTECTAGHQGQEPGHRRGGVPGVCCREHPRRLLVDCVIGQGGGVACGQRCAGSRDRR